MPGEVCRPEGARARACGAAAGANGPHAEDPRLGGLWGQSTRGERTPNMPAMFVTLDVSKLSGWLNADAYCRESKGGHTVRGGVRPGRRRTTVARAACRRDSTADWGQGHGEERTLNM